MCQFPLNPDLPCGINVADYNYLMALVGVIIGTLFWYAIYSAFLN